MIIITHALTGLIIGALTKNYLFALIGSLFVDLDHLIPYIKNGILFNLPKLWKTITSPEDPYGNQRNILHSIFGFIVISGAFILINKGNGLAFSIGYFSHLILDALDGSIFYPFYPIKKFELKGPITYFSIVEIIIILILLVVFLFIIFK